MSGFAASNAIYYVRKGALAETPVLAWAMRLADTLSLANRQVADGNQVLSVSVRFGARRQASQMTGIGRFRPILPLQGRNL